MFSGFDFHYGCAEIGLSHLCFVDDLLVLVMGNLMSVDDLFVLWIILGHFFKNETFYKGYFSLFKHS